MEIITACTYHITVNDFFSQELVLPRIGIEQTPIHFNIPRVGEHGAYNRTHNPQVEERIVSIASI